MNRGRADGNLCVSDENTLGRGGRSGAENADEGAAVESSSNECGVGNSLAAQDDAGVGDAEAAENFMATGEQKHCAAKAVGIRGKAANVINGGLDAGGAIAGDGFYYDTRGGGGDGPLVGGVTGGGEVQGGGLG